MARLDPQVLAHLEWLGFIRPTGLVVSAPALVRAGAILDQRDAQGQRLLRSCLIAAAGEVREPAAQHYGSTSDGPELRIADFRNFATTVLDWRFSPRAYAGTAESPILPELEVVLPDAGETLRPDYAVRELEPPDGASAWQLLVRVLEPDEDFDSEARGGGRLEMSAHSRMERLLRQTGVPAGLLVNGRALRLVSAPRGESSGWLDFRVADMVQTAGRPICTALRLLLSEQRLLALPRHQRLAALLADSRRFQNEVSEKLAEQVLHALYELLRGFQAAHDASKGKLLRQVLAEHPDEVYHALLTVILRLVFLLYAEERDMLPEDETFLRCYSVAGLHERLREDAALYPDTMDQRYGAWAQLVALFRMVHNGAEAVGMRLPPRKGVLFDPDRFPFLEGRASAGMHELRDRIEPPLVPDGTVQRALEKLLVLDSERLSYRALDVEQIGSVYETMMGFRLETASGRSLAIRSQKKQGAPTALDLELLLSEPPKKREKWIQDRAARKPSDSISKAVAIASTVEDLHAALLPITDLAATPDLVPQGAMVLQPSEERRRSGSHYTPRTLTEPIVRTTLAPLLAYLRGEASLPPTPAQILQLKVCDPAMGSGAFLVEACRQLAEALIEAWRAHNVMPTIPQDEDEVIFARRVIAQRCLYGVDRNPVAVDLAKMSLWLVTLAKDHALTFLDHALQHGDSLVGLSRKQIEALSWEPTGAVLTGFGVREKLDRVFDLRRRIREADESISDWELRELWSEAKLEIGNVRLFGDLVVAAFFQGENPKEREAKRGEYATHILNSGSERYREWLDEWRHAERPLVPFHWEIEFPEVFERQKPGFDAMVGNPPFAGKNSIAAGNLAGYPDWLKQLHEESHGNADIVAHFFRRAFNLLREAGAFGLIATKTIREGDTRETGLRWICSHSGEIYSVRRRLKWPGLAAVTVSIVHLFKGRYSGRKRLDDREVDVITAFLFHRGGNESPLRLVANADRSFLGSVILGMGFTFDDSDTKGVATPIAEMQRLIAENPRNGEVIFPYIGYAEVANSPTHSNHRYVINFGDRSEEECRQKWPDLMALVEEKVRPEREHQNRKVRRERWWQYAEKQPGLYAAVAPLRRVLVAGSQASAHFTFAFVPVGFVYSSNLSVIAVESYAGFAVLQSRVHEVWARFFMSTLEDRLAYTATSCFEPFPFRERWESNPGFETAGKIYYEFRAALMVRNSQGLTEIYNRFNDPEERNPDVIRLRELHMTMDRAVLDAYGWHDIPTDCEFVLDYEIDEDEWGDRKKPYRYRWSDEVRDEVLARLLELNAERSRVETLTGAAANTRAGRQRSKRATGTNGAKDLFS